MESIVLLNNIVYSNIIVKKPKDNAREFHIRYNKKYFYIQTPVLKLKYNPLIFENGYTVIEFILDDPSMKIMEQIETTICKKISRKFPETIHNFKYSQGILHTRCYNKNIIQCFDLDQKSIQLNKLAANDIVIAIIQVDKYIMSPKNSYILYSVHQILKCQYVGLFETPIISCDFSKYRKMLSLGIPMLAVQQKMKMDGMDEQLVQIFISGNNTTPLPPPPPPGIGCPPPPPPPPPPVGMPKMPSLAMSGILKDIASKNFNLKKANISQDNIDKKKLGINQNQKVPSLQEIQDALKKLRKINYNEHQ